MPDCFIGPFDDLHRKKRAAPIPDLPIQSDGEPIDVACFELPRNGIKAAIRGASNHCPSCGSKPLFAHYLKPIARCEVCSQDWTPQQADDFPAYVSILITGHVLNEDFIAALGIVKAAAARANIEIPHFCYHPELQYAGSCRMCLVEVEKSPKLVTACSTIAADGMVVRTKNDRVKKARAAV